VSKVSLRGPHLEPRRFEYPLPQTVTATNWNQLGHHTSTNDTEHPHRRLLIVVIINWTELCTFRASGHISKYWRAEEGGANSSAALVATFSALSDSDINSTDSNICLEALARVMHCLDITNYCLKQRPRTLSIISPSGSFSASTLRDLSGEACRVTIIGWRESPDSKVVKVGSTVWCQAPKAVVRSVWAWHISGFVAIIGTLDDGQ